jgi:hypothetical protein
MVVAIVPLLVLASLSWATAREILVDDGGLLAVMLATVAFATTWLAALTLAGLAATWRSALWTVEVLRRHEGAA